MQELDYSKPVIVRYGVDSLPFRIEPGFCVVDLIFNEHAIAVLGFSPFNVRLLRNGLQLSYLDELVPGEAVVLETAVNIKGALPGPKFHKCERYRRKQGFGIARSKGDHAKWIIGDRSIPVNYCGGELDLRSLKDLAHHLKMKPRDLIISILTL